MEIKFDMDNFEHSLKQHADQFSMIPSKRVWNGVYNSLHPGSKWPSITMVLIFLLTLVGIGPLNNTSKNIILTSPDNTQQSITEENESNLFSMNTLQKRENGFSEKGPPAKVVELENYVAVNGRDNSNSPVKSISSSHSVEKNDYTNKSGLKNTEIDNSAVHKEEIAKSLKKIPNAIVVNIQDYKKDLATISKESTPEIDNPLLSNYTFDLKDNFNPDDQRSLAFLIKTNPGKPVLIKIEDGKQDSEGNTQTELNQPLKQVTKGNGKTTWIFFATPSVSTTYFTGEDYEIYNPALNSSPLVINPNQGRNSMRFNARLGLNLGAEINHAFSDGWEIISGAQISYSGYNILAHKVHPTFSYLYLKEGANSIMPHKYITYYGSGLGLDEVVLHNNSLQLSVPVGIKHSVWKNNNLEIKIGTSVQPSLLLNGRAYILSTDGRNYVTDDQLMRTVNVIGEFNSSISFQGDKVKWHVGPVVRYQALSTYKKNYPVNEHLIDYGIRIGISK